MTARALMVQGTASHVGKTVLVAGLCRLFHQQGVRVAPFKAQNMALNSFATADGREIGRAQAVQAEAAGVEPTVDMNPILLKPETHARCQLVVEGRIRGTLNAADQRRKGELWPIVQACLSRLMDAYDLVLIEGAGSPAEVNLKEHDIVNMRVAREVEAPVLLAADIDRGGVFASLVGTMELLDPEERALVAGFIVNKFRGDRSLFEPGVAFLERRLGRPSLGVVPWIEDLRIADEDSQGLPRPSATAGPVGPPPPHLQGKPRVRDVVVIRLPHVANFDDFDPLEARPDVRLRYVDRPQDLGEPDLLILPGTKTTRFDLQWLRERGLEGPILAHARRGGLVVGICGGYQMLGERIDDPAATEGPAGAAPGLRLLPAVTRFTSDKRTVRVSGRVVATAGPLERAAGPEVTAYEIHMGETVTAAPPVFSVANEGGRERPDGCASPDGRVIGTYLHGLFRNRAVADALLGAAEQRDDPVSATDPYDRLADVLRSSLDLERLRRIARL